MSADWAPRYRTIRDSPTKMSSTRTTSEPTRSPERRGASRVIGLDLSASLAHARSIAERADADVEFVHANVRRAPSASGNSDLVYTSIVASYAGPDNAFGGRSIASLLAGRHFLHPR